MELNSLILAISGSGIGLVVWRGFKVVKTKLDGDRQMREGRLRALEAHDALQEHAIVAQLHHQLYELCNHHLAADYISTDDLDDLRYIYDSYHDLGGNGTGKVLYHKVLELPIKNKDVA